MGPELDVQRNTDVVVEISEIKENKNAIQGRDDTKGESAIIYVEPLSAEQTVAPDGHEDVEINITECTNNCNHGLVERELQDETENSSSFADTVSGTENGLLFDDEEVESQQYDGNLLEPDYEGYREEFQMRQKKLTMHWRKFIRPLMWRCKWTELQIRELNSKALKYDSELAFHDKARWFVKLEAASDAKSLPLPTQRHRNKVLKRSKRKRIEETLDVASYMLHHNLFSYYGIEKKKSDGVCAENFGGNLDKNSIRNDECGPAADGWSSLNLRDGENSMEYILSRIGVVQSEVQKLKCRVDKIVNENSIKFSSINDLSFLAPSDTPNSPQDENKFLDSSRHESEYLGDMLTTEGAISSLVSIPLFSDLIEGAEKSQASSENTEDDILIHNQAAMDELRHFENVRGQFTVEPRVLPEELKPNLTESLKVVEPIATPEPQSATNSNFDGNKRKRKRRRRRR